MAITLKGLTWDHPRGYAPLLAGVAEYRQQKPEINIEWGRRTLREFGEAPIEQYLDRYDLMIVDHPFAGLAAAHGILVDLAPYLNDAEKDRFARDSVGPSWDSYWYEGGLWAYPIDAATQVASYRPDLMSVFSVTPPESFDAVLQLGRRAREVGKFVIVPACPTDAISLFFTLSANLGYPIPEERELFVEDFVAREVLERLHVLISVAHPASLNWNPIQVYNYMVSHADAIYCPYAFGYSNYSRVAAPVPLKFTNAPGTGTRGCAGTMLGGTGVAVSATSAYQNEAVVYAKWLTSPEHQGGTYVREGGQPASLATWRDPSVNAAANDFFSNTLPTLQTAYVRPRFDGFVRFFEAAGIQVNRCLRGDLDDCSLVPWLNERYAAQRASARQIA